MKLHTHITNEADMELQELTPRHFHQLPWVDPDTLPLDAELQVYRWNWELGVVWLGDFGMYRCLPNADFMIVIHLIYEQRTYQLEELEKSLSGSRLH